MAEGWQKGLAGQRVLVTGATGFIGRRLTAALVRAGARVAVLSRSRLPAALAGLPIEVRRGTLSDAAAVRAAVAGQDVIFSLAYDVRASAAENRAGFETLVAAAEAGGRARIVHLSSIVVYDGWPDAALTESAPCDGAGGGPYRQTKIAMERRLIAGARPAAILQPTLVWGPGSALWTDVFADALSRGAVALPEDAGRCQGVFVDDVVQACLRAALLADLGRERFIVNGPAPFPWRDLIEGYRSILHQGEVRLYPAGSLRPPDAPRPPDTEPAPSAAARLGALGRRCLGRDRFEAWVRRANAHIGRAGEMRPDAHLFALYMAHGSCPPDLARVRLGYRPAFGLSEGLAATAAHLRPSPGQTGS